MGWGPAGGSPRPACARLQAADSRALGPYPSRLGYGTEHILPIERPASRAAPPRTAVFHFLFRRRGPDPPVGPESADGGRPR